MNTYSRMRSVRASKSRSVDFSSSDPAASPPPEEPPNPTKIHENNGQIKDPSQDEGGVVMKLKRNSSCSSSDSSAIKHAVNRTFSVRRPSSVSERYCRIHDQPLDSASPFNEDEDDGPSVKHNKKSSRRGKFLKACKKLLGL